MNQNNVDAGAPVPELGSSVVVEAAKAIKDLDLLVRALLTSVPDSKPWQRQLRAQLSEADRTMQVLRLTIAMDREAVELRQAAKNLLSVFLGANARVHAGRADQCTRAAIQLGLGLTKKLNALMANAW